MFKEKNNITDLKMGMFNWNVFLETFFKCLQPKTNEQNVNYRILKKIYINQWVYTT